MDQYLSCRKEQLYRQLLNNASKGLTFSQDVMWEMGPDNIPYSKVDFSWLFCASGPLAPSTRSKNKKQGGMKVLPHHARLRGSETCPLPVLPPVQTIQHHSLITNESFIKVPLHQDGKLDSVKRIGLSTALNVYNMIPYQFPTILQEETHRRTSKGNKSVLKNPKINTAQWIVSQQIPPGYQYRARLPTLLKDQNGSSSATNLITEESKGKEDVCGFCSVPKSSTDPRTVPRSKPESPLPVYYGQVNTSYSQHCCYISR